MMRLFENMIKSNKERLHYMIACWRYELDNYRNLLVKSKDKKLKALMKPLTLLEKKPPI